MSDNIDMTPRSLAAKWQPDAVAKVPQGDYYGHQSIQDPVLASLIPASFGLVCGSLVLLVKPIADNYLWQAIALVAVVTLLGGLPATQRWIEWYAHPIYISLRNGQMLVGQTAVKWAFIGGSSPDTVNYQIADVETPKQRWRFRVMFWFNERVAIPKHGSTDGYEIKLPKRAISVLYAVQEKYQTIRSDSATAAIESRDYLKEIRDGQDTNTIAERLRLVIREEIRLALQGLPHEVAAEVAKSFRITRSAPESSDADKPSSEG